MDKVNIEVIEQSFTELFNQKFGAPLNVRGDNILLNTQFSSKVREFVLSFFKPYLKTNEQLQQEKEQYLDEFAEFVRTNVGDLVDIDVALSGDLAKEWVEQFKLSMGDK